MNRLVLYSIEDTETEKIFLNVVKKYSFRSKKLKPADERRTLASIIGLPKPQISGQTGEARPNTSKNGLTGEDISKTDFIIMYGLSKTDMDSFLNTCKTEGISSEVLKAVATPVNLGWTVGALKAELVYEHRKMRGDM